MPECPECSYQLYGDAISPFKVLWRCRNCSYERAVDVRIYSDY